MDEDNYPHALYGDSPHDWFLGDPKPATNPAARIRTLEAELAQARADARALAAEVNAVREAQRSCTCETCGKRGPAYASRINTDASGALQRNKP